jgi:hypothetical protein
VTENLGCALKLHRYMTTHQWVDGKLVGPDSGVRANLRVTRFIRSYLDFVRWNDSYYYLQAQGYWVLANWRLFAATASFACRDIAARCSDSMLSRQNNDGSWTFANPEWRGRIPTAEGAWACIGLLQSYRETGDYRYLDAVLRWHRFLIQKTGFQHFGDQIAVNYFANRSAARVPNNSAFIVRFLAELADVTGDDQYLQPCSGLIRFLANAQTPYGELPYALADNAHHAARPHYQCYQYNSFQCLDLLRYFELTSDPLTLPILHNLLAWLTTGIDEDGHVRFDCYDRHRRVFYHTTALAAALHTAGSMGIAQYKGQADRCFSYIRSVQCADGRYWFSQGDYRFLSDRRSYPRNLAMMLFHLLTESSSVPAPDSASPLLHTHAESRV